MNTPEPDVTAHRQSVDRVLKRALEVDSPAERQGLIEKLCVDDPAVKDEVLALLACDEASKVAMEKMMADRNDALASAMEMTSGPATGTEVGQRIGNFRIIRLIATGGMGAVYEAERADGQFQQTVAIKVLPAWASDKQTVARLRAERQILSSLQHPNITQLLSGGETVEGLPFLVTEYIDGLPITEYAETHALSLDEKLELICQVADAVHHAHTRLVVHRDIKPSNILVDKQGRPHLLDFGIAKLIDPAIADITQMQTVAGFSPMTLRYASPEQRANGAITTACDVWQLGLLLYRLVAGQTPDLSALPAHGIPPRPSSLAEKDAGRIRGDLDTIVLKALRERPSERYASASELEADIQRFRHSQAISARRETAMDVTRRLIRRNPWGATALAIIMVLVTTWAVSLAIYSKRLETQRDLATQQATRADRVKNLLTDVYRLHDPLQTDSLGDKFASLEDSLDIAMERLERQLSDEPDIQAELYGIFSTLYQGLGRHAEAIEASRRAESIYAELGEGWQPQLATTQAWLAGLLVNTDQTEANQLLASAVSMVPSIEPYDADSAVTVLVRAALERKQAANWAEAIELFEQAQQVYDRNAVDSPSRQIEILFGLGRTLVAEDRIEEAESPLVEALELAEQEYGKGHARLTGVLDTLSGLERNRGNLDLAVAYSNRVVEIMRRGRAENYDNLLSARNNLALALAKDGQLDVALPILEDVVSMRRNGAPPEGSANLGTALKNLATIQHMAGDLDPALRNVEEAQALMELHLPPNSAYQATPHFTRALIYLDSGQPELARESAGTSLDMLLQILDEEHYQIAVNRCVLGEALLASGDVDQAGKLIAPAYKALLITDTRVPRYELRCQKALNRWQQLTQSPN